MGVKILFVDDEKGIREQVEIFFERQREGFEINTASDSEEAVDLFKDEKYDAIISDYKLPEKSGIDLLKYVRRRDDEVPFIMLTGKGDEDIAIKALNLGADRYFRKKTNPRELYKNLAQAVKEVVKKSRKKSPLVHYNPKVSVLLKELLDGDLEILEPDMSDNEGISISYPEVVDLLELSKEESLEILESLVDDGYLKKKFYDQFLSCPSCFSSDVKLSASCPKCGSLNTRKKEIIEHLNCGYQGETKKFEDKNGDYICPKCKKELKAIGVDYAKMSDIRVCKSCGEISDSTDYIIRCEDCEKSFDMEEGEEKRLYSYHLKEKKKTKIRTELKE